MFEHENNGRVCVDVLKCPNCQQSESKQQIIEMENAMEIKLN